MKVKVSDIKSLKGSSDIQSLKSMTDAEVQKGSAKDPAVLKPLRDKELAEFKRVEK